MPKPCRQRIERFATLKTRVDVGAHSRVEVAKRILEKRGGDSGGVTMESWREPTLGEVCDVKLVGR